MCDNSTELSPAERLYRNHLKAVANYQKKHPEKCKEKARRRAEAIKADPERLAEHQAKRRKYYEDVKSRRQNVSCEIIVVN
jgi:hypothetical protein